MYMEKVNYTRTFNLGNYSSEKIGVEMSLNAGENAIEALDHCRKLVEEYHQQNVKRLTELGYFGSEIETEPIQIQNKKSTKDTAKDFIINSKTLDELKSWQIMSNNNEELKAVYEKRLNELLKKNN